MVILHLLLLRLLLHLLLFLLLLLLLLLHLLLLHLLLLHLLLLPLFLLILVLRIRRPLHFLLRLLHLPLLLEDRSQAVDGVRGGEPGPLQRRVEPLSRRPVGEARAKAVGQLGRRKGSVKEGDLDRLVMYTESI